MEPLGWSRSSGSVSVDARVIGPPFVGSKGAHLVGIEVTTKDCSALGDVELTDMADLTAGSGDWEVGRLGKEAQDWVLVGLAERGGGLQGFLFSTLERIGGTPALVLGPGATQRGRSSSTTLRALMAEQYHRALMAFPDEDVLVAARMTEPGALEVFDGLDGVRPQSDAKVNGEERAWGRRLAKRYQTTAFDDRSMVARAPTGALLLDHTPAKVSGSDGGAPFDELDAAGGEHVIAWGWARFEFLARHR
jgi:hypothetical protein